jgi:class 3 adenylate cyclase/tetratricopeptide (TPR) repeat protein
VRTCPNCGEENPARARFCLACGVELAEARDEFESRRTVTVVFLDLVDSTAITGALDPEAHRRVQGRFFDELRAVLERHGGTLEKFIGDAVMAVFGIPTLHEDDALRAVRAATEAREAMAALNAELRSSWGVELSVRIGVNTGEVVAGDPTTGQRLVTGEAVNLASRLEAAASPGEILIGADTYRLVANAVLVEPVEGLELKGVAAPTDAWRVLGVLAGAPSIARRLDSPLVGRERELRVLRQTFERAAADRTCQLVTILGPAGAGKSRLAAELLSEVSGEATTLVGRCLPYGEGITFWPVVEIVKRAAGLGPALSAEETRSRLASVVGNDPDAEAVVGRLEALLGLSSDPGAADEIFWAVRKLLQALAARAPVVVAFDDVHWGEKTFLDLLDHLSDWSRESPILLVCLARSELLESRPSWAGGKLNATSLLLEPLPDDACGVLIENLLDRAKVAAEVKERIAGSAEGNPLFVEELLAMLIDQGALRKEDGHWVAAADLSSLDVPPTIQALLDARLDRLDPGERGVLERAAVAGRIFSRGAVRALSPDDELPLVGERLAALVRKQLIRHHEAELGREHTYRFRHTLIREAAYRQLAKGSRAALHERFTRWLEGSGGKPTPEQEEIIGYHLEQAFRFRQELGDEDAALGTRAGELLAAAGRRAVGRGDLPASVSLLTRAASLLPESHEERRAVLPLLGGALMRTGDFGRAELALDDALEAARAAGDRRLELRSLIEREFFRAFTKPEGSVDEIATVADEVIPELEELGDDLGLAKAWWLKSEVHVNACRWGRRAANLERALEHARKAGDAGEQTMIATQLLQAVYYGPTPVEEAIERCEELLAVRPDDRSLRASVVGSVAGLRAMQGDFAEARRLQAEARTLNEELGHRFRTAVRSLVSAEVETLAGRPEEATAILRWAFEELDEMGITSAMSTLAAFLADALATEGERDEALRFARLAEELGADEDVATQVMWRIARATASRDAELAAEAVRLAEPTDSPDLRARAYLALAQVTGDGTARDRAVAEYERKGNRAAVARLVAQGLPS